MAAQASTAADVLVIFGITGDLPEKMTFQSLYRLERRRMLQCPISGSTTTASVRLVICPRNDPGSADDLVPGEGSGSSCPGSPHRHVAKSPAMRRHHPQAAADLSAGAVAVGERTNEPSAACSMTMRVSSTREAMLSLRKA
jgi:hypothetical protein